MASVFPLDLDRFTIKKDRIIDNGTVIQEGDDILAQHINDLQDSVVAVQTTLGKGVNGEYISLSDRIKAMSAQSQLAVPSIVIFNGNVKNINGYNSANLAGNFIKKFNIAIIGYDSIDTQIVTNSSARVAISVASSSRVYIRIDCSLKSSDEILGFISKISLCGAYGIFLDNFGYHGQMTRETQNYIIDACHSAGMSVIVSSSEPDDCLSGQYKPVYNVNWTPVNLRSDDAFLYQGFAKSESGYQDISQMYSIMMKLNTYRNNIGIKLFTSSYADSESQTRQQEYYYITCAAMLYSIDAMCVSKSWDITSHIKYADMPLIGSYYSTDLDVVHDGNKYYREASFGQIAIYCDGEGYKFSLPATKIPGELIDTYGLVLDASKFDLTNIDAGSITSGDIASARLVENIIDAINTESSGNRILIEKIEPLFTEDNLTPVFESMLPMVDFDYVRNSNKLGVTSDIVITNGEFVGPAVRTQSAYFDTLNMQNGEAFVHELHTDMFDVESIMPSNILTFLSSMVEFATVKGLNKFLVKTYEDGHSAYRPYTIEDIAAMKPVREDVLSQNTVSDQGAFYGYGKYDMSSATGASGVYLYSTDIIAESSAQYSATIRKSAQDMFATVYLNGTVVMTSTNTAQAATFTLNLQTGKNTVVIIIESTGQDPTLYLSIPMMPSDPMSVEYTWADNIKRIDCFSESITRISGDMIETGSITADNIDVENLSASMLTATSAYIQDLFASYTHSITVVAETGSFQTMNVGKLNGNSITLRAGIYEYDFDSKGNIRKDINGNKILLFSEYDRDSLNRVKFNNGGTQVSYIKVTESDGTYSITHPVAGYHSAQTIESLEASLGWGVSRGNDSSYYVMESEGVPSVKSTADAPHFDIDEKGLTVYNGNGRLLRLDKDGMRISNTNGTTWASKLTADGFSISEGDIGTILADNLVIKSSAGGTGRLYINGEGLFLSAIDPSDITDERKIRFDKDGIWIKRDKFSAYVPVLTIHDNGSGSPHFGLVVHDADIVDLNADKITAGTFNANVASISGGDVTIDSEGITVDGSAGAGISVILSSGKQITLNSSGLISENFTIGQDGSASFSGTVTATGGSLSSLAVEGTITVGASGSIVAGGTVLNSSGLQIASGGSININNNFIVDDVGKLTADNGTLKAMSISGRLSIGATGSIEVASKVTIDKDGIYIQSGSINIGAGKFSVTGAGALTATDADITGAIKATSGYFGNSANGMTINAPEGQSAYLEVTGTGYIKNGNTTIGSGLITVKDATESVALKLGLVGTDNYGLVGYKGTDEIFRIDKDNPGIGGWDITAEGLAKNNIDILSSGTISLKDSSQNKVVALGLDTTYGLHIYNPLTEGRILWLDGTGLHTTSGKLAIDASGNVTLDGTITAKTGYIGGLTISDHEIHNNTVHITDSETIWFGPNTSTKHVIMGKYASGLYGINIGTATQSAASIELNQNGLFSTILDTSNSPVIKFSISSATGALTARDASFNNISVNSGTFSGDITLSGNLNMPHVTIGDDKITVTGASNTLTIESDSLIAKQGAIDLFKINSTGVYMTGTVEATSGWFGTKTGETVNGVKLNSSALEVVGTGSIKLRASDNSTPVTIDQSGLTMASGEIKLGWDGTKYAFYAGASGVVANSGSIAGWSIDGSSIYKGAVNINSSSERVSILIKDDASAENKRYINIGRLSDNLSFGLELGKNISFTEQDGFIATNGLTEDSYRGIKLNPNAVIPVEITGDVYATGGYFKGIVLVGQDGAVKIDGTNKNISVNTDDVVISSSGIAIKKGSISIGSLFSVDSTGNLSASNVDLTGFIKATSGWFGAEEGNKIVVDESGLTLGTGRITDNATDPKLILDADGIIAKRGSIGSTTITDRGITAGGTDISDDGIKVAGRQSVIIDEGSMIVKNEAGYDVVSVGVDNIGSDNIYGIVVKGSTTVKTIVGSKSASIDNGVRVFNFACSTEKTNLKRVKIKMAIEELEGQYLLNIVDGYDTVSGTYVTTTRAGKSLDPLELINPKTVTVFDNNVIVKR